MFQLTVALLCVVVGATGALWVVTLYKLLPLYRSGAVRGGYQTAFQVAVALLSWVTMQIVVWLFLRQDALAMLLSVLWAIGLLAWLTLSTVANTRRQVQSETTQAQPVPQSPPDVSDYTVRRAPAPAVQPAHSNVRAARSARVRRIMAVEE